MKLSKENIVNMIRKSNYSEINSKAAEVAFYLLLSLFPFLLFTISVVVYIPVVQINKVIYFLQEIIPDGAFQIVKAIIKSAIDNRSVSLVITSFVLTIWTSSRAVRAFIRSMNKSYNVKETRSYFKIFTIAMIFTVMLLLLVFSSMIFLVYGERLGHIILDFIGMDKIFMDIWNIWRYLMGGLTVVVILLSLYIYTPNKKIAFKEAIPGAIIGTLTWFLVSYLYSYYSSHYANYEVIYGSIGEI
ncbi:MAG: YihY/virulence factor BrkB family protein, partial [Peptostreptococcaceae bacterium]